MEADKPDTIYLEQRDAIQAFVVGACYGYDSVINGASLAMPAFTLYFGDTAADAMTGLAQAFGSFMIGFAMDKIGRKWSVVAMAVVSVAGATVQFVATTRGVLLCGRMRISTSWSSEISPAPLRGPIQSALVLFQMAMQMTGLGVIRAPSRDIQPRSFRIAFAIQWPLAAILVAMFAFVPESPLMHVIRHENSGNQIEAGNYTDCFKGTNLKRTLTVVFVLGGLNICGAQLLVQNIYFLLIAGLLFVRILDIGIGGMGLGRFFTVASWDVMEKLGCRLIFLSGPFLSGILLLVVGGLYYALGLGPIWAVAIILNFLIAWGVLSFMSVGWVIGAELSSYKLRAKTQTRFIYAGLCIIYLVMAYFVVPESSGLSIAELDWMYENKVPSQKFQAMKEEARSALVEYAAK
ncbi:major facilitator superfamily domain-containing protein [Ilyonectria destructans]|nr:major facilitator superfamily domain-containing protein [Ilyonectria destructans]